MTYVAPQALVAEGDRVDPAPDGINLISEEEVLLFPPPSLPSIKSPALAYFWTSCPAMHPISCTLQMIHLLLPGVEPHAELELVVLRGRRTYPFCVYCGPGRQSRAAVTRQCDWAAVRVLPGADV